MLLWNLYDHQYEFDVFPCLSGEVCNNDIEDEFKFFMSSCSVYFGKLDVSS